jgi:glycosyltransferase involved in cell wall biosynthesis
VSVVIPTRDRPRLLQRALASALRQVGVVAEVVIVDDGGNLPVTVAAAGGRVRVLRRERSEGVSAARNVGIAAARGEWVAFLDDDDVWAPTKLESQLAAAASGQAGFSFTGTVAIDLDGAVRYIESPPDPERLHDVLLTRNGVSSGSNLAARTDLVRSIGGFDESLRVLEDWDINLRLASAADAAIVPEPLVAYLLHAGNAHRSSEAAEVDLRRLQAKHVRLDLSHNWWLRWRLAVQRESGDHNGAAATALRLALLTRDPSWFLHAALLRIGGEPLLRAVSRLRHREKPHTPLWLAEALTLTNDCAQSQ